jgi:hypothetical protein
MPVKLLYFWKVKAKEALFLWKSICMAKLVFDYLPPSAWASICAIAEKLDGIGKSQKTQGTCLDSYKNEISVVMQHQVKLSCKDLSLKRSQLTLIGIVDTPNQGGSTPDSHIWYTNAAHPG